MPSPRVLTPSESPASNQGLSVLLCQLRWVQTTVPRCIYLGRLTFSASPPPSPPTSSEMPKFLQIGLSAKETPARCRPHRLPLPRRDPERTKKGSHSTPYCRFLPRWCVSVHWNWWSGSPPRGRTVVDSAPMQISRSVRSSATSGWRSRSMRRGGSSPMHQQCMCAQCAPPHLSISLHVW